MFSHSFTLTFNFNTFTKEQFGLRVFTIQKGLLLLFFFLIAAECQTLVGDTATYFLDGYETSLIMCSAIK